MNEIIVERFFALRKIKLMVKAVIRTISKELLRAIK